MKFAFLGYHVETGWETMSKAEQDEMIEVGFAYDSQLRKEGHLLGIGVPLQPTQSAKTLRWRNGKVLVTDGPFAETNEQLAGTGLLDVDDMAHAVDLMSNHPGLRYGVTFEIRPIDAGSPWRRAGSQVKHSHSASVASLGYIDPTGWASVSVDERDAMLRNCAAFDEGRVESGQWVHGIALQGPHTAKTLRVKAGQVIVTDGPFAETKEYLGGAVVLGFKDVTDAVATLSAHPALRFGVTIEIRPIDAGINETWEASLRRG